MSAELGFSTFDECQNPAFDNPINFGGSVVYTIVIVSMGTFSFLTFGTSGAIWKFWKVFAILVWHKRWDEFKLLLTDKKFMGSYKVFIYKKKKKRKMRKIRWLVCLARQYLEKEKKRIKEEWLRWLLGNESVCFGL